jgi:hypothetical protein
MPYELTGWSQAEESQEEEPARKKEDEQIAEGSPEPQRVHILSETSGLLIKLSTIHASEKFFAKEP